MIKKSKCKTFTALEIHAAQNKWEPVGFILTFSINLLKQPLTSTCNMQHLILASLATGVLMKHYGLFAVWSCIEVVHTHYILW